MDLLRGEEIGHREYHVAFNRALQVAGAIPLVGSFLKQELPGRLCNSEEELALRCLQNTLLNHREFDVEDLLELRLVKWVEHHDFVEAVHELG